MGVVYLMVGIYGYALLRRYDQLIIDVVYFCIQIAIGSLILLVGSAKGRISHWLHYFCPSSSVCPCATAVLDVMYQVY